MGKDFFDDDVLKSTAPQPAEEPGAVPVRSISDLNLARMARQREASASQMVDAAKEIEELRRRQEELEREKSQLEKLARRQESYERGKRDILDKLGRGVVLLEKESSEAARMVELIEDTRKRFRATLGELKEINENGWPEGEFENELNRALALVENADRLYRGAEAKIRVLAAGPGDAGSAEGGLSDGSGPQASAGIPTSFWFWLKVGFAIGLPLILAGIALYTAHRLFWAF